MQIQILVGRGDICPICAQKSFWVKVTITKMVAAKNSLASVVKEMWAKINPDHSYWSFTENLMKHCYVHCTQKLFIHLLKIRGPAYKVNKLSSYKVNMLHRRQNTQTKAAVNVVRGKNASNTAKIDERNGWQHFCVQLPCLPNCDYGNSSVSWTLNVATRLTSLSHKYSIVKVKKHISKWFLYRSTLKSYA